MVLGLGNSIVSGTALDSGYVNQHSLLMDGVGDGLRVTRTEALRCKSTNSFTIGAWVSAEDVWDTQGSTTFTVISCWDGGGWTLRCQNKKVIAYVDLNNGSGGTNEALQLLTAFRKHPFVNADNSAIADTHFSTGDGGYQLIVMTLDTTSGTGVFKLYIGGGHPTLGATKDNDVHLIGTANATSGNDTINYAFESYGTDVDVGIGYTPTNQTIDGATGAPSQYLEGFMDEAFIMNTALSHDQLKTVYNNGAGIDMTKASGALAGGAAYDPALNSSQFYNGSNLVGLWRMDEGEGTTVEDSSGNNHTATIQGDPDFSTTVRAEVT